MSTEPREYSICHPDQKECTAYNLVSYSFVRFFDFLNYYAAALTFLATLAIGCFTATLWRATTEQARITNDALKLARDEFNATHRPHIRVRRIDHVVITPQQPITATIEASNIGVTDAIIAQIGVDIFIRDKINPIAALFNARPGNIPIIQVPPGKSVVMDIRGGYKATPHEIAAFQSGSSEICALGIIIYTDSQNIPRVTSFFRIYDLIGARFIPAPNDATQGDREYEN